MFLRVLILSQRLFKDFINSLELLTTSVHLIAPEPTQRFSSKLKARHDVSTPLDFPAILDPLKGS